MPRDKARKPRARRKVPGPPTEPRPPSAPVRIVGAEADDPVTRGRVVDAILRMIDGEDL